MPRKLLYIINPIAGTRSRDSVENIIRKKTESAGLDYAIYPSVANGDYRFLFPIIKEQKFTDVIIAGGDGTINQVVGSLKELDLPFGIIPCGSGNGLAFSAAIPKNAEKAIDIIFRGKPEQTDAFLINNKYACMLCGLGFDAQVAHDFAHDVKRGLTTYIRKTVKNFFSATTYPFMITVGNKKIQTDAFFISIANSNQFGNHFTIAPNASLTDGKLDIVILTKQSKLSLLLNAILQVTGFHHLQDVNVVNEKASLIYFQTESINIKNNSLAPMHIDGDPVESIADLDIRILNKSFRLIHA